MFHYRRCWIKTTLYLRNLASKKSKETRKTKSLWKWKTKLLNRNCGGYGNSGAGNDHWHDKAWLWCDADGDSGIFFFGKYLRRTAERTNCEVLDNGCILDFKGALELHNGPVLAFTAAAFHRNVHLWDVDVDVAQMPLQILKLNHVRRLLPFKITRTHTHTQAGWEKEDGREW